MCHGILRPLKAIDLPLGHLLVSLRLHCVKGTLYKRMIDSVPICTKCFNSIRWSGDSFTRLTKHNLIIGTIRYNFSCGNCDQNIFTYEPHSNCMECIETYLGLIHLLEETGETLHDLHDPTVCQVIDDCLFFLQLAE